MSVLPRLARTRGALMAVGLAAPLALAACGGSSGPSGSTATTAGASGSSTTSASASGSSSSTSTITAKETEYHIALSSTTAQAGKVTFKVTNAGQVTHDLVVDGPGVQDQKTSLLSPGQTVELVVTLQAGTYELYCGIPGHKQAGMDTKLTVS